jgi:hypothetical protein
VSAVAIGSRLTPGNGGRTLLLLPACVLLNGALTFVNVWPTPAIRWQFALSVEFALALLAVALWRPPARSRLRTLLPILWLVLVVGRYLDVTAPGLYGRDFNLYWDAPHLINVAAMLLEDARPALLLGIVLALAVGGAAAYALSRLAWNVVADAVMRPALRAAAVVSAVAFLIIFAAQQLAGRPVFALTMSEPVATEYMHQARSVLSMLGPGAAVPRLGPSPAVLARRPDGLRGADVYLVFVESYGAVVFDRPDFVDALAPSRSALADAVRETGRFVVSTFVESPTFGGSSWLAHLTLMSGIAVRDPYSYQSLMAQERDTLSTTFQRAGYRAVALMPGMRQAWPEGAFYRYQAIYGRDALDYQGPRFGWWSIPDQYALAKLDALEGPAGARPPLFVVFPTSTTHAPFGPVAPYQPDWSRVLGADAYDEEEVARILARPPDLVNLAGDYTHAMAYEFTTFAGYLRERADDDLVMILVGDHQPPAAVAGRQAPWTVPVHVIARDTRLRDRLRTHGFRDGLTPSRPALGDMHSLVPVLLEAFTADGGARR